MSVLLYGFSHEHVTEREIAHYHPDGRYDDAHWEDCTFCAFIEFLRASGHPTLPATHREAEDLRDASGRLPTGGTNLGDCVKGALNLHKIVVDAPISGATAIWNAMVPGTVAAVQGSMAAFPDRDHFRRWDPAFKGAHCATALRVDAQPRVWWCDPNAPQGTGYEGEWMEKVDFIRYINSLPGAQALVAPIVPDEENTVLTIVVLPFGGTFTIPANTQVTAVQFSKTTGEVSATKTWAPQPVSTAHYDATVTNTNVTGNPFVRCLDGFFAPNTNGPWYISAGQVTEVPNPAPPAGFTQAQVDKAVSDAKAAQKTADKANAIAVISAL